MAGWQLGRTRRLDPPDVEVGVGQRPNRGTDQVIQDRGRRYPRTLRIHDQATGQLSAGTGAALMRRRQPRLRGRFQWFDPPVRPA